MSLHRVGKFFGSLLHSPVEFPNDQPPANTINAITNRRVREASDQADVFFEHHAQRAWTVEATLVRAARAITEPHDAFLTWYMRSAFTSRISDLHRIMHGERDEPNAHRIRVLCQQFMAEMFLHASPCIQNPIFGNTQPINVDPENWRRSLYGARAVAHVITHMARPNRLIFFPRTYEDMRWKIDLIIIDTSGDGLCCQIKSDKTIGSKIIIEELCARPRDDYLRQFYSGTAEFNRRFDLNFRPVVFTVGW